MIEAPELIARGLDPAAAHAAAGLFKKSAAALSAPAQHAWWVPGRIEILGKHTDYCGGQSLVCATGLGIAAVALPRTDQKIIVHSAGNSITLASAAAAGTTAGWGHYVATLARRMAANFPPLDRGMELSLAENLPRAAGLSSSSALLIAVFCALARVNHAADHPAYRAALQTPEQLASYLGCIENGQSFGPLTGDAGVGTFGGSQDHAAIMLAQPAAALRLSYGPLAVEELVPLPKNFVWVIADSGVEAIKTGAAKEKYNRCSRLAQQALAVWNQSATVPAPTLFAALAHSPVQRAQVLDLLAKQPDGPTLVARARQLWREAGQILPAAAIALQQNDLTRFGALVDESQAAAAADLGNQVPETITLAAHARRLGAQAASAFGAGFGGAVWALVPASAAADFGTAWLAAYHTDFPTRKGRTFITTASTGAVETLNAER